MVKKTIRIIWVNFYVLKNNTLSFFTYYLFAFGLPVYTAIITGRECLVCSVLLNCGFIHCTELHYSYCASAQCDPCALAVMLIKAEFTEEL